jgi:hypothetical protein
MGTVVDIVDEVVEEVASEEEVTVEMASPDADEGVTEVVAIRTSPSSNTLLVVM